MCQTLLCDCWWCNCFSTACAGLSCATFCCGMWCCKHEQLASFDYNCCTCCTSSGFGNVFCCIGAICCAPEWLNKYSKKKSSKKSVIE